MPIYTVLNNLKQSAPLNLPQATNFINNLPLKLQEQVIAAIYIGRDHIHATNWNSGVMLSTTYTDHIPQADYARIIYEKNTALITYLDSIERCAKNSGFDLNNL